MKSIMELLKEAPTIEYDPSKGITMEEISEMADKLQSLPRRKPEYILSMNEAKQLPLWQLKWLCENNTVLCSFEVQAIIKEREKNEK